MCNNSDFKSPLIFISYSRKDSNALKRLQVFLQPVEEQYGVSRWDDTQIDSGGLWKEQISSAISSARVAILLVSADFLASEFIRKNELPSILIAAKERGLKVLPVVLSHCRYNSSKLSVFQAVNSPEKPLSATIKADKDAIWFKVSQEVEKYVSNEYDAILTTNKGDVDGFLKAIALSNTASRISTELNTIKREFDKVRSGHKVSFKSSSIALEAYLEAVQNTESYFCVTTFLDSEFWSSPLTPEILDENRKLSERIRNSNGIARRIFLVDQPIESYITRKVQEALRHQGDGDLTSIEKLKHINRNLEFLANYFQTRIMNIDKLPLVMKDLNPAEFELALYDQFRIDRFKVDKTGSIVEVDIFPKDLPYFNILLTDLRRFFEEAWCDDRFRPVEDYIEGVNRKIQEQLDEVDYTANWLLKFDKMVQAGVPLLHAESNLVIDFLESQVRKYGQFEKYLDVGVCTGRYPDLLSTKKYIKSFDILDRDEDSEMFLQIRYRDTWKSKFRLGDIRSLQVKYALSPPYELITCMLGTASHFGLHNHKMWYGRSGFYHGILNILNMLTCNGLFVFSVWSDAAVGKGKFLDIYQESQRRRLIENNPTAHQINQALNLVQSEENISIEIEEIKHTEDLDVYFVRKR